MKSAAAAILALASLAAAAEYPHPTGYVNDFAGRFSPAFQQNLESRLRAYEQSTSREIAVATVPSLPGESIESYATGLYRAWGIGKRGANNGVLFLWAPAERKIRIAVGSGLDNVLTHPVAWQIIEDVTARFRTGDFEGGTRIDFQEALLSGLAASRPEAGRDRGRSLLIGCGLARAQPDDALRGGARRRDAAAGSEQEGAAPSSAFARVGSEPRRGGTSTVDIGGGSST